VFRGLDTPVFCGWVLSSFLEGFADLPVVAEGVEDAAYAPGVLGSYGADDGGSGGDGAVEGGVGVVDGEDHADGAAVEGLGAEVLVFGGFVGDPEAVAVDGEIRDYGAGGVFVAEDLLGSEGGFVEVDGFGSVADGEEGGEGGGDHQDSFRVDVDILRAERKRFALCANAHISESRYGAPDFVVSLWMWNPPTRIVWAIESSNENSG
jgi:hypothetical protein